MSIYEQILAVYPQQTAQQQHNARIEVAQKIATTDLRLVCEDVLPFLIRPEEIKIWSQEYFRQIAGMIRME